MKVDYMNWLMSMEGDWLIMRWVSQTPFLMCSIYMLKHIHVWSWSYVFLETYSAEGGRECLDILEYQKPMIISSFMISVHVLIQWMSVHPLLDSTGTYISNSTGALKSWWQVSEQTSWIPTEGSVASSLPGMRGGWLEQKIKSIQKIENSIKHTFHQKQFNNDKWNPSCLKCERHPSDRMSEDFCWILLIYEIQKPVWLGIPVNNQALKQAGDPSKLK